MDRHRNKKALIRSGGLPAGNDISDCRLFANLAARPGIRHGIFSRRGGCSTGPFDSLNVSFGVGDRPDAVAENRKRLAARLGADRLVYSNQVHGDTILVFRGNDRDPADGSLRRPATGDAMVTDIPGLSLVIQVADCQAVVLYDPARAVVAAIHSGWRGSIVNIIGKTVAAMSAEFGCDPADLLAGVGPSLGPCCAEFVNYRAEIPETWWRYRIADAHFDFWSMSRDQLCQAGVPEEGVCVSGVCTCCNADRFFSYRAQNTTGRFAVAIGLV